MRTDIHRPSAIIPADYHFVGFNYAPVDRDTSGLALVFSERARIAAHMSRTGGTWSTHEHGGNCFICGAHCIYTATFHHVPTNVYIRCGLDCTDNMDMDSGLGEQFRRQVREGIEARRGVRKAQALCDEHGVSRAFDYFNRNRRPLWDEGEPLIPESFSQYEESTIIDIVAKLVKYGSISDKQWGFVGALLRKIDTRAQREAQRASEHAASASVPQEETRMQVEGEVVSIKTQESPFGTQLKMLVKHAQGYKLWGTVPASLRTDAFARGSRVRFTAMVKRSPNDEKFGFFSRPTNAEILPTS